MSKFTLVAAMLSAAALAAAMESNRNVSAIAKLSEATRLEPSEAVIGFMPASTPVHIVVSLKLRERETLDRMIVTRAKALTVSPPTLTSETFLTNHAPTEDQARRVVQFLNGAGFKHVEVTPDRMLVSADGTVDVVQGAFQTTLARVRAADGAEGYANTDAVQIPVALQDTVLAVLGLQNIHRAHTAATRPQAILPASHNPSDFPRIYGADALPDASGVTVGIIAGGSVAGAIGDLGRYTSAYGGSVTTEVVTTNGVSNDTQNDREWSLDSQSMLGMAGAHIGKIIFYTAPSLSNADVAANVHRAVQDNVAKIINISLGDCERNFQADGSAATMDQDFLKATLQDQTFSVSSGDFGSTGCKPVGPVTTMWPASSQYVVAVGGTLLSTTLDGAWRGETVWHDGDGASGGGISSFEPMPAWQVNVGANANQTRRGVPDIAYDGALSTGANVYVDGVFETVGGTSLAAPLFAGAWARVIAARGTGVGFAAPKLYRLPASDFHDVTSGNNGTYSAAPGWDYTTGFGSLILTNMLQHLGGTPVANFTVSALGRKLSFTDTSTDVGGTLSAHAWTFGDGGTSSEISPVHTYTIDGTYPVTETVADAGSGATSAKSVSVSVVGPRIYPTPNQVILAAGVTSGTYTLTWNAPGYSMVTLYGKQNLVDPGKLKCLGSGPGSGSAQEPIKLGERDDLYLLAYTGCTPGAIVSALPGPVLANTVVTAPVSTMTATPSQVVIPPGASSGSFTLTWNAPGRSMVTLYGKQNIDNPGKIQCLGSGPGSGSAPQSMKPGEIAVLSLAEYSGCTPGSFVTSVPNKLVEITVITR